MLNQIENPSRQRCDILRMLGLALQRNGQLYRAADMLRRSINEQETIPKGERSQSDKVKMATTCNELAAVKQNLLAEFCFIDMFFPAIGWIGWCQAMALKHRVPKDEMKNR